MVLDKLGASLKDALKKLAGKTVVDRAAVEELIRDVDAFLDGLFTEGAADATILHGHGTGALKQALREHLARSPYVGSFRAGEMHEGGDAVTVVLLRR